MEQKTPLPKVAIMDHDLIDIFLATEHASSIKGIRDVSATKYSYPHVRNIITAWCQEQLLYRKSWNEFARTPRGEEYAKYLNTLKNVHFTEMQRIKEIKFSPVELYNAPKSDRDLPMVGIIRGRLVAEDLPAIDPMDKKDE